MSRIVLVDWIVTEPPPAFLGALSAMSNEASALGVRDQLFAMWTTGVADPRVLAYVRENMGSYPAAMWARAAREIAAAYAREGSPLAALSALTPPCPTLHLYAQPDDPGYLIAQQQFSAAHRGFWCTRSPGGPTSRPSRRRRKCPRRSTPSSREQLPEQLPGGLALNSQRRPRDGDSQHDRC
ncbi:MAG: hypothetical protein ABW298_14530 [Candidatus Binatia bacterium]